MKEALTLTGIVLTSAPSGENDKRVVILTRERGRITAFARGARRPNSALLAPTNTFAYGQFQLFEGRSAYTLIHGEISNYFEELMNDFKGACYGMYFCELAGYFTRENADELPVLKLLYQSLRALINKKLNDELVRYIFELKIFVCAGEYPDMYQCQKCGSSENLELFSCVAGGLVCNKCRDLTHDAISLTSATVYTMQYIIGSDVERLYTFTVSQEVVKELAMVMRRWRGLYLDREMRSLEILESLGDFDKDEG